MRAKATFVARLQTATAAVDGDNERRRRRQRRRIANAAGVVVFASCCIRAHSPTISEAREPQNVDAHLAVVFATNRCWRVSDRRARRWAAMMQTDGGVRAMISGDDDA